MDKKKVHFIILEEVKRRKDQLIDLLSDAQEATANDTKSSAGDKHETSRAMAQLEQEKIGGQIAEMNKLQEVLHRIDPEKSSPTIHLGSLIQTNDAWFYLSVGIGSINVGGEAVFCMTLAAPLGKLFLAKKAGDSFEWQGKEVRILRNL